MSAKLSPAVARGLREGAALLLGVVAMLIMVALLSYSDGDPGFSYTGSGSGAVGNLIGPFGAWLADVLFFLFGRPAYLFPMMLAIAAWQVARKRVAAEAGPSRTNSVIRLGGFVLVLVASCALATLHGHASALRQSAGGIVGSAIGHSLASAVNFLGATWLLLVVWMTGVSLAVGVSWLHVMDQLGAGCWRLLEWLRSRRVAARDSAIGEGNKQARKDAAFVEQKKSVTRVKPRIEAPTATVEKSERVEKEKQVPLFEAKAGELPPLQLLDDPPLHDALYSTDALENMSRFVEMKLKEFGVEVEVVAVLPGPVITRFELRPSPGTKASQITSLSKDLARALSTVSVRVVEVIPGKSI